MTTRRPGAGARRSPRRAHRPRAIALLLAATLMLAACSGDDAEEVAGEDPQGTEDPATMSRISPLTGEVLPEQPGQPVVAVKIDNSGSARQIGLGKADMVVEELVEGGITRLATFYYSRIPADAGPVRSMRATDIGIVTPLDAVIVASGAAGPTWKRVRAQRIRTFTEGDRGFYRGPGSAPYNLMVDMAKLTAPMDPLQEVPPPYLPFGDEPLPRGKPAKRFTAVFSESSDSVFELRGGRYVNTDGYASRPEDDFVADTVLVLRVKVGDAGYLDPSGARVPETKFTGRGPATIFHDGRMVTATWVKDGLAAPVTLRGPGGELQLPPGQVRIELVPTSTGAVRVG